MKPRRVLYAPSHLARVIRKLYACSAASLCNGDIRQANHPPLGKIASLFSTTFRRCQCKLASLDKLPSMSLSWRNPASKSRRQRTAEHESTYMQEVGTRRLWMAYKIYAKGKVSTLVCVMAEMDSEEPRVTTNPKTQEFPIVPASGDVAARAASLARLSSSPRCTTAQGTQQNIRLDGVCGCSHSFRTLIPPRNDNGLAPQTVGQTRPNMTKLIRELR